MPHSTLHLRGPCWNTVIMFDIEKLEQWIYQMLKKSLRICLLISTQSMNVMDTRQMNRHHTMAWLALYLHGKNSQYSYNQR